MCIDVDGFCRCWEVMTWHSNSVQCMRPPFIPAALGAFMIYSHGSHHMWILAVTSRVIIHLLCSVNVMTRYPLLYSIYIILLALFLEISFCRSHPFYIYTNATLYIHSNYTPFTGSNLLSWKVLLAEPPLLLHSASSE